RPGGGGEGPTSKSTAATATGAVATAAAAAAIKENPAGVAAEGKVAEPAEQEEDERELCRRLVEMRAEKQLVIRDLREKIKAAGGGVARSISGEFKKFEIKRAVEKAREAKELERKRKVAAITGKNTEIYKLLPPRIKRNISNLRRLDAALVARYEACLERIKKLLLSRGFAPAVATGTEHPSGADEKGPRKWTTSERKKEAFLHSLTPQLERWRARIVATTLVLEDEKARRDAVEAKQAAATGDNEDLSPSPGRTTGEASPWGGDGPHERPGNLPTELPISVPCVKVRAAAAAAAAAAAVAAAAAAAAAIRFNPGGQATRGDSLGPYGQDGGGGGAGRSWRPLLSGHGERVGEGGAGGDDQARWQEANRVAERARGAYRGQFAEVSAADVKQLIIDSTTARAPAAAAPAPVGTFLTPRRPSGSPMHSAPSPRSPNVPSAARCTPPKWHPQRPFFPAPGNVGHQDHTQQTAPLPLSTNAHAHAGRADMGSHQVLKYFPLTTTTTTNHKNIASIAGFDGGLHSTAVAPPTGAGVGHLHYSYSEPRLVPQSAHLSQRLPPFRQQQQQQTRTADADGTIDGGTVPPGRASPPQSFTNPGGFSRIYDASEHRRRQQLFQQQLLLKSGRRQIAEKRAATDYGGNTTSMSGEAPPSSPKMQLPSSLQQQAHQQPTMLPLPHQQQFDRRDLDRDAETLPLSVSGKDHGHDGNTRKIRSSSPRLQHDSTLRLQQQQQQQDEAASLPLKPPMLQHWQHSPRLASPSSPVMELSGASLLVLGESLTPTGAPSSPPGGSPPTREVTARGPIPPALAVGSVAAGMDAAGDDRQEEKSPPLPSQSQQPGRRAGGASASDCSPAETMFVDPLVAEAGRGAEEESRRIPSEPEVNACVESWDHGDQENHGHQWRAGHVGAVGAAGAAGPAAAAARAPPRLLLATASTETNWTPLSVSLGKIRTAEEIIYSNRSPTATTPGLRPIHPPPPVFADDNKTPLQVIGANVIGDVAAAAAAAAAAATATAVSPAAGRTPPSSPPGRWQGEVSGG
ncbi:unnamed protein product, partial [Pylaiella littoralis]